jgi:hypothetical protein
MTVEELINNIETGVYDPPREMQEAAGYFGHERRDVAAPYELRAEEGRLLELFKADLLAAFNMTNHPKANAFWRYVWDVGRDFNKEEVVTVAEEVAELMEDTESPKKQLEGWLRRNNVDFIVTERRIMIPVSDESSKVWGTVGYEFSGYEFSFDENEKLDYMDTFE